MGQREAADESLVPLLSIPTEEIGCVFSGRLSECFTSKSMPIGIISGGRESRNLFRNTFDPQSFSQRNAFLWDGEDHPRFLTDRGRRLDVGEWRTTRACSGCTAE